MYQIEELIKRFNKLSGKRHDVNSVNVRNVVERAIAQVGEEKVVATIETANGQNISIYECLDIFKLSQDGANPATATPAEQPKTAVEFLGSVFEKALAQAIIKEHAPKVADEAIEIIKEYVHKTYGKITRQIEFKRANEIVFTGDMPVHEVFQDVLDLVTNDEPVYLHGDAGTGKNVLAKQIADAMQLNFYFAKAVQQPWEITGFQDANGVYHETEFYRAFTKGGVFFLDELDASIPEVLILLNAAIANRYFDFPKIGQTHAHANFRVVAAGNTIGQGATREYSGRSQLDAASLNRFAFIHVDYSPMIENAMTDNAELLTFARDFRKAVKRTGLSHILSYRELKRMQKMITIGWKLDKILRICLLKGMHQDDARMIRGEMTCDSDNQFYKAFVGVAQNG